MLFRSGSGARGAQLVEEVRFQSIHADALLLHGVAIPHSDGAVVERLDVDADAPWCADLVLPSVELPDRGGIVIHGGKLTREAIANLVRKCDEVVALLQEREHCNLVRCKLRVQCEDGPLLSAYLLLSVRIDEEGEGGTVGTCRGLDDPRYERLDRKSTRLNSSHT